MVDNSDNLCYNTLGKGVLSMESINKTRNLVMTAMFTALITAGAFIKIPIPVCPFTLQFLFTTLAGIILGRNRGAIAAALYLILGLAGLPIFAGGGGIGYVLQPTFGYLIGFIAGAYITGAVAHGGALSFRRLIAASFAGLFVVYAMGMCYYWLISRFWLEKPIGLWSLFLYCFLLAVPGDICLCILSAVLGKRLLPVIDRKEA